MFLRFASIPGLTIFSIPRTPISAGIGASSRRASFGASATIRPRRPQIAALVVASIACAASVSPAFALADSAQIDARASRPTAASLDASAAAALKPAAPPSPAPPSPAPMSPTTISPTAIPPAGPATAPADAPAAPEPFVLHLPGIGGYLNIDRSLVRGLQAGGVHAEFQIYDWTEGDSGLDSLFDRRRNLAEAQRVADRITQHFRAQPGQPIVLTCHSGGAGIAVWALQRLPADVFVSALFMMAPALSPGYDLTPALRHVHGPLHVFTSPADGVLGEGTKLFGTIDGVKTEAAGRVGFQPPPAADPAQYAKIVYHPYQSQWLQYGDTGDHIGAMRRAFAQALIAPLVKDALGQSDPATRPAE